MITILIAQAHDPVRDLEIIALSEWALLGRVVSVLLSLWTPIPSIHCHLRIFGTLRLPNPYTGTLSVSGILMTVSCCQSHTLTHHPLKRNFSHFTLCEVSLLVFVGLCLNGLFQMCLHSSLCLSIVTHDQRHYFVLLTLAKREKKRGGWVSDCL